MALDNCHQQVEHALQKEGWIIEPTPRRVDTDTRLVYIDIEASRQSNGTSQHILLVEVKCFSNRTNLERFVALGQYLIYRAVLAERQIFYPLYLSVPADAYDLVFDTAITSSARKPCKNHDSRYSRRKDCPMDRVAELTLAEVVSQAVAEFNRSRGWKSEGYYVEDAKQGIYMFVSVPHYPRPFSAKIGVMARIVGDRVVIDEDITDRPLYDALIQYGVPADKIIRLYAGETLPEQSL